MNEAVAPVHNFALENVAKENIADSVRKLGLGHQKELLSGTIFKIYFFAFFHPRSSETNNTDQSAIGAGIG